MKKLTCVFMAIAMCLALAVPVLADNVTGTNYGSSVQTPTIKITGSASNTIILNPYNIAIAQASVASGESIASGAGFDQLEDTNNAGVIAPTTILKNESDVPIKLSISVTGSIPQGSTATFSATEPAATEKTHKVFMYVVVADKGVLADGDNDIPAVTDGVTAGVEDYDASAVYSTTNPTGTQAVVKAGEVKMTNLMTLDVPDTSANTPEAGYVTIDIGGQCSTAPETPWAATDTVAVALAYTFVASNNSVSSGA